MKTTLTSPPVRIRGSSPTSAPASSPGAADDDPSGISTYSVAGAATGYSMLWLTLISTPMMAVIQGMCARIAMVTGEGLAAMMRKRLPRLDRLRARRARHRRQHVQSSAPTSAGWPRPRTWSSASRSTRWVFFFGIALIAAQIWLPYRAIARIFKWLTLALFAYVVTAFVVHPPWVTVLHHFAVPQLHFDSAWLSTMVGVLGTTITPYLFFWQAVADGRRRKEHGKTTRRGAARNRRDAIRDMHADINTGMIYSNLVAFFIIVTTAATLGAHGKHDIATAQQAAQALRPLAGKFAALLFTLGMVGTGMLAVPVLAGSSAYVAAETFRFVKD